MSSMPHVVEVSGSPRERGHQQGEELRPAIREHVERWADEIGRSTGLRTRDFVERHLSATGYLRTVDAVAPDLLVEVRGIADGAGMPFDTAFALQLMDEEWLYVEALKGRHHCSSLATAEPERGIAFAAQTMDLPAWMHGSQTVVRHSDPASGLHTVVLTAAGMIGLTGVNSAGLAIAVNTLADLPSASDGLPVAFVGRSLLATRTVGEARRLLQATRHAAGQNYILCDREAAEDWECSASGVRRFMPPEAEGPSVWHTNHPLAEGAAGAGGELAASGGGDSSQARMAALDARLGPTGGARSVEAVREALASRDDDAFPINRPLPDQAIDADFTFATVIWEVAPEPRAHICAGPKEHGDFLTLAVAAG